MYVKLGKKAETFSDPITGLSLCKGEVKELSGDQEKGAKIRRALAGGHLSVATKDEFNEFNKSIKSTASVSPTASAKEKEQAAEILKLKLALQESEDEKAKLLEVKTTKALEDMDSEELIAYYEKNYEIKKDELKRFSKLSPEDMLKELKELEEE